MSEIYKEDEMAPLVLPRDRGRVLGETEETIKAKDEAQATLPPPPSIMPTVKEEPMDDEESQKALSLDNTPAPESSHASSLAPADEEQKKPTIIKSEQVANGFMQDKVSCACILCFYGSHSKANLRLPSDGSSHRTTLCVPIPPTLPRI